MWSGGLTQPNSNLLPAHLVAGGLQRPGGPVVTEAHVHEGGLHLVRGGHGGAGDGDLQGREVRGGDGRGSVLDTQCVQVGLI